MCTYKYIKLDIGINKKNKKKKVKEKKKRMWFFTLQNFEFAQNELIMLPHPIVQLTKRLDDSSLKLFKFDINAQLKQLPDSANFLLAKEALHIQSTLSTAYVVFGDFDTTHESTRVFFKIRNNHFAEMDCEKTKIFYAHEEGYIDSEPNRIPKRKKNNSRVGAGGDGDGGVLYERMQIFWEWMMKRLFDGPFDRHHLRLCNIALVPDLMEVLNELTSDDEDQVPLFSFLALQYTDDSRKLITWGYLTPIPLITFQTQKKKLIDAVLYAHYDDVPQEFRIPGFAPRVAVASKTFYASKRSLDKFFMEKKINENGPFNVSLIDFENPVTKDTLEAEKKNMEENKTFRTLLRLYKGYFTSMARDVSKFPKDMQLAIHMLTSENVKLYRGNIDEILSTREEEICKYFLENLTSKYSFLTAVSNMWKLRHWAFLV